MVLTIDIGTQSLRAMIIDKKGTTLCEAHTKYNQVFVAKEPGWAEQNPIEYWNAIIKVCRDIEKKDSLLFNEINAISITAFRDSVVFLDEKGEPVRDCILWLDQRKTDCSTLKMPFINKLAFTLVGMADTVNAQRIVTKTNYVIEHERDIWDKTYKCCLLSGYIMHKFTHLFVDAVASEIGHIPIDYKGRKWKSTSDLQYPIYNVPPEKLIELKDSGEVLGYISETASKETGLKQGLPIIATGSDKSCETLGCGVLNSDIGSLSFGTAATIQLSSKKYFEPMRFLPAYPGVAKGYYNPEVQIYRGYWMLNWFVTQFAGKDELEAEKLGINIEEYMNSKLNDVPIGCDGLLLQPYWSPLLQFPEARGSIIGFRDFHTRYHMYRSIIEGINYALMDGMNIMAKRGGMTIKSLTLSGGGSQSPEICQITADMFGLPIKRIQTHEACSLGCSLATYVALGEFHSYEEAIENMVHYEKPFMPDMKNYEKYQEIFTKVYKKLYGNLRSFYKHI